MTNWGIIGLGTIAHTFATDLKLVSNANLYGVASRDLEKAIVFRDTHDSDICYSDYKKLANDPNVDIVYIATPHVFHFENAKMCLERGKAVLCEKPMGMNASEVKQLTKIAKENNALLMEAMWTAFLPNFQYLQKMITENTLGAVTKLETDFCFVAPKDPKHRLINKSLGGGALLDIGIYTVFTCLELLGIPKNFSATAEIGPTGVDLNCEVTFNYPKKIAYLKSSFKEKTPTEIHIQFEKGTAILGPNFFTPSDLKIITPSKTETIHKYQNGRGYQLEALHFQNLFETHALESPIMTHAKSIRLATYLDEILEKIGVSYK